jgi:hypothetical protein
MPNAEQTIHAILDSYFGSPPDSNSDKFLTQLLTEHAAPVIESTLRQKLGLFRPGDTYHDRQVAEDISSDIILKIIGRLRDLRADRGQRAIEDFRAYVAATTINACHQHLREKYPLRWRLKNRIRYLLTHKQNFAMWEGANGEWLCGMAAWRHGGRTPASDLQQVREQMQSCPLSDDFDVPREQALDLLLTNIFARLGGPAELESLVSAVAELQGVKEVAPPAEGPDGCPGGPTPVAVDPRPDALNELEATARLRRLWAEIRRLTLRQRVALLLNLRDRQGGSIELLPASGVASIRQIAEVLEIPAEKFAAMWNELPLEDARIAEILGVSRQQVINLRKAARERLARRTKLPAGRRGEE